MNIKWCHICAKESGNIPNQLEQLLPEAYNHIVCHYTPVERGFTVSLKLKLDTREEAETWLEEFQRSSKVTLRIDKTYPVTEDTSRRNGYRVDMRCQHNTRHSEASKRNTHCPAVLYLVLKKARDGHNRKSRSTDRHRQEGFLCHITIKHEHNHHLTSAEALQHRDVARETIEKLKKLFQSGHSPSSALNKLKYDLQEEKGDAYVYAAADRSICPDIFFCYRLYYSIFKTEYGASSGDVTVKGFQERLEDYNDDQGKTCAHFGHQMVPKMHLKMRMQSMFEHLMNKLDSDAATFQAPVESLVSTFEMISTDSGLISFLCSTGKDRSAASQRKIRRRGLQTTTMIGVQPTAVSRRKTSLGERRSVLWQTSKTYRRDHNYGKVKEGSGVLPRRPAAPHSLAQCVSVGVSLGGQHTKK